MEQVRALRAFGFTERQARFLMLVLEHSGVCLPRQYRASSGVAHGRHSQRSFAKLIAGGFASTDLAAPAHAGRITTSSTSPGTGRWARPIIRTDGR